MIAIEILFFVFSDKIVVSCKGVGVLAGNFSEIVADNYKKWKCRPHLCSLSPSLEEKKERDPPSQVLCKY